MTRWLRHLRAAARRPRLDDDLAAELEQHVAWRTQALIDEGVEPVEARRRALVAFGNVTRVREEARSMWGFPTVDSLAQDVQYGVRLLRRSPMFSAVAILSLAIGIGAGAAVFSLADALLFRKLPVRDPDSLVVLKWRSGPVFPFGSLNGYGEQTAEGLASTSFSHDAYERFRHGAERQLDLVGFADLYQVNLSTGARAEIGHATAVSGSYFDVLGVRARTGRLLGAADDVDGASPAVAISDRCWQRWFARAPDVVGRTLSLNGAPFTVVGVTQEGFQGTGQVGSDADVYVSLAMKPRVVPNDDPPMDPNFWWVLMMARLKPQVRVADARGTLDVLLKQSVAAARPSLAPKDYPRVDLLPGARGQVEDRDQMRDVIRTMAIVTAIVLLVACANVANLLLARGSARVRELSVRAAIGAPRMRIVRQLLTEAVLLAVGGSALGVLLARWMAAALIPALATGDDPIVASLGVDGRMLAFFVLVASGAAIAFGLVPALRATDIQLVETLQDVGRSSTHGRQRRVLSRALVVAQIALSLLLGTAAGLLVRSARNLQHADLGFDPSSLLLFRVDPAPNGYQGTRVVQFYSEVLERLRATPGVRAASLSNHRLISNSSTYGAVSRPDETAPPRGSAESRGFNEAHGTYELIVDEQFFSTMGIRFVRGRTFTLADENGGRVAVINRSLARRLFGNEDVLGRQIKVGLGTRAPLYQVVGVCADARYTSLRRPMSPTAYFYYRQPPDSKTAVTFEVRTAGPPQALAPTAQSIVGSIDPLLPVFAMTTQAEQIQRSIARERLFARLASLLGGVAVLLCAIGLYGLLAYNVVRRTPEIGVRMALGADARGVAWMILRESMRLAVLGLVLGIPAALAGTRVLGSLLYELPARDPATLTATATVMLVIALLAGYVPARRAARVDPLTALRA